MRKAGLACSNLIFLLAFSLAPACAQAPLPDDPKEAMLQAANLNGLTGAEVQPWHLKASFKIFDKQGAFANQGSYEELWASAARYRRVYSSSSFSQTEFGTEKGPLVIGARTSAPDQFGQLRFWIVNPLPGQSTVNLRGLRAEQRQIDGVERMCLDLGSDAQLSSTSAAPLASYCFDMNKVLVEAEASFRGNIRITFRNPIVFQGRTLPGDLVLSTESGARLVVHLESIEPLNGTDEAQFEAPADAVPEIRMIGVRGAPLKLVAVPEGPTISAELSQSLLVTKVAPIYPPIARAAHVQGTVVLQATIGKEGKIADLHVVDGHPLLQQAAMDAVQQWIYRPYMLNGAPVEVRTTVNVVFQLGPPPKPE